jgi:hypothetical protein
MTEVMTERSARDLFRAAYENRYTWDENFPGYTADVSYHVGGQTYTAKAQINPDFKFEVTGIDDEEAKKAIQGQVWEIAVHRVRNAFEQTHGQNTFTLGETDETGAVEISVSGKSEGDRYKLRNNQVSMVHRHIHGVVVTIYTSGSQETGNGYLSTRYDSVYHDAKTGEPKGERSEFEDSYEKVGNFYLLSKRVIHTAGETVEFDFNNLQLLG